MKRMRNPFLPFRAFGLAVVSACVLAACGGSSGDESPPATTFVFRSHGMSVSEDFRATTTSPEVIAQARAQLRLPVAERRMFPSGALVAGNGGVNPGWSWHLDDLHLAEMTIELCDARPSMVEADLAYWIGTVKRFCPWTAYVHAEVVTPVLGVN